MATTTLLHTVHTFAYISIFSDAVRPVNGHNDVAALCIHLHTLAYTLTLSDPSMATVVFLLTVHTFAYISIIYDTVRPIQDYHVTVHCANICIHYYNICVI